MSKYAPLRDFLAAHDDARVEMTFPKIEAVIGSSLPDSARSHRPWWANTVRGHSQSQGWLAAGYRTAEVDLAAERLVFVRLNAVEARPGHPRTGDHPLFGCMAGTISIAPGVDLTAPLYDDAEMAGFDTASGRLVEARP
ncbi:MAG: hypothetical protein H3C51_11700 [Rubellimicrobium sp.]|nr:hypothetical protein [Rubellimicrobium sp.]